MNCREAKQQMALHLGHDGDRADWEAARRHVARCPDCRHHFTRLKQALAVIEQADQPETYERRDSLWPNLEARLGAPRVRPTDRQPGWIPFTALALACLLLISVWSGGALQQPPHEAPHMPRQAVNPFGDWPQPQPQKSREAREAEKRGSRPQAEPEAPVDL